MRTYNTFSKDASWLPQISLRENLAATQQQLREQAHRELLHTLPLDAISNIVQTLRRHPIFYSLSESDLRDIAARFQRRR
jgi:hypothetical protein